MNSCNLHCDYCKSSAKGVRKNNERGVYDVESPIIDADFLVDYIVTHLKGYIVQLTGGEPLTHPAIGYLLRTITKTNPVIVCTNGDLLPMHEKLLDIKNIVWRISYHPEYRKNDIHGIVELVENHGADYIINYVCHPRHIENDNVIDYIKDIRNYNHEVSEFEGSYRGENYRLMFPIYDGLRTPVGDIVDGLYMLTVRPNGLVYSCHGKADEPIGDVYANSLYGEPCKMHCSHCGKSLCPTYISLDRMKKAIPSLEWPLISD